MKKTTEILLLICLAMLIYLPAPAKEYTVESVPNVHVQNRNRYISDPANLMDVVARENADRQLKALEDSTSAEIVYVILPSIGDADIFDFTQELAEKWGVGKKDINNGLIVVIVMDRQKIRFHTGRGMEGVIPDITARRIIDKDMAPYIRENDLDGAVSSSIHRIKRIITDPEAAAEIASADTEGEEDRELSEAFKGLLLTVIFCSFALSLYLFISMLLKSRRKTNYQRVNQLGESIVYQGILSFFSAGMAIPVLLLMIWMRFYYRNKPIVCDTCGNKMHKLSEDEDNKYLSPEQDTEEQLKSVDYDVWLCDKCGTTEVFPYKSKSSHYTICPQCHTRAMGLLYDRIERMPTTMHVGRGVKVYGCKYCGHRHNKRYEIAKLPVIIAGGGGGHHGGGGGGISGGSFGGGSFGGGGATGGW